MTYRNVEYPEAVAAANKGLPFTLCWEFSGANGKNKSGTSNKFWLIERTEENGTVYRRFGKKGTTGQRQAIPSVASGLLQGRGKEHKGYALSFASVVDSPGTGNFDFPDTERDHPDPRVKPLISKMLPPPFCHIRMVHEAPIGTWNAYDTAGNIVVTLDADTAAEIKATYTLA